jgi:hypothetical protein
MAGKAFFLQRLNDHVQYLKKIDNTLKGQGDFQGCNHHTCKLGVWMEKEGPQEVASLGNNKAVEVFESMKDPHEKFHTTSMQALEKKLAGDEEGSKSAMTEMHTLSALLSNKLLELDKLS